MSDPVEIFVEPDPKEGQERGDWVVRVGRGRGGKFVKRHLTKSKAMKSGRAEGRKRRDRPGGAILYVKKTRGRGRPKVVATYGDARGKSRSGFFGFF